MALVATLLVGVGVVTGGASADTQNAPAARQAPDRADKGKGADQPVLGAPGTHVAHDQYGYPYPEAPDCDESTLGNGGCVPDARGFYQGQCTSWVAHRLSTNNAIDFTNWYAGQHWGDAADWNKAARAIGHRADKVPAAGAVAWFKHGHVAYVESVNSDGSIVISEMNYDGHNGFRLVTVYPGSSYWPTGFIHLADVVPSDVVAPTRPTGLDAVTHNGRTGLAWHRSSDAFGVTGYRVLRDGVVLGTTRSTTFWDRRVSPGQTHRYQVVAFDAAANTSSAASVRTVPDTEAADRAWVSTAAGPALCGRTGSAARPAVGCTVLTDKGWRRSDLARSNSWGAPESRRFVPSADGSVSYCRVTGGPRGALACTRLDPRTLSWGYDRISRSTPSLARTDRTWVSTSAGPARCGRSGGARHPGLTCSVLTDAGWQTVRSKHHTRWGTPASRVFVAGDRQVSYCRTVRGHDLRLACTSMDPVSLRWSADHVSAPVLPGRAATATWVTTGVGPAWCTGSAAGRPSCRVLTWQGWRAASAGRSLPAGAPLSRAFVAGEDGSVSWCRTLAGNDRAACTTLDAFHLRWSHDVRSAPLRSARATNQTWVATDAGPALCTRSGRAAAQRVTCQVLDGHRWSTATTHRAVGWGEPAYRAFVPSDSGVAWCRTERSGDLHCNRFLAGRSTWGADLRARRTVRTFADRL
jgi:surface antigen